MERTATVAISSRQSLIALVALAMVIIVFIADWVTPTMMVVGMAYQAPVVFAGFKGTRLLTIQVLVLSMIGIGFGWFMDFAANSYQFNGDDFENRALSIVSLMIVGSLTLIVQRYAAREASR